MNFSYGVRIFATTAAISSLTVVTVGRVSAEPDKVQYELQERCAKAAASAFKNDNPDGTITDTKDGQSMARYENHYNVNLNKCFVEYFLTIYHVKSEPKHSSESMTVFDVNENKEYGSYLKDSAENSPWICVVRNKPCHSDGEWRDLIKAYMED